MADSKMSRAKIFLKREDLVLELQKVRARGKVVLTNGCFDILHVGHVRYLEQARALGGSLVVALNQDTSVRKLKGPSRPVNVEMARAEVIAALACVDYVCLFGEDTAEATVSFLKPDLYVKGGDWKIEDTPEGKAVLAYGGQVQALKFTDGYSTTSIIERMQS